jgi:hypothetical protein
MAKITVKPDCGNAPKMTLLRDFTSAFANGNSDIIIGNLADDIRWEMVGDQTINNKSEAKTKVVEMLDGSIEELNIDNIVTHGDAGAVQGTMKFRGGQLFSFCDFYNFTSHGKNAKIKRIQSYVVEINK